MSKAVTVAGWDDVPHLSAVAKEEMLSSYPAHQRGARSKGIPALGSGAIYRVPIEDVLVDPFPIPDYYRRAYGCDVGWNRTAAVWGAHNADTDVLYLYDEHYRAEAEPPVHASAIKARGDWIPGVIDPAARGRSQRDGMRLLDDYRAEGLDLHEADNVRDAGLLEVQRRLTTGRLKVFRTLGYWVVEYKLYRRDEKGRVVKQRDHLMDATRYLVMSGLAVACVNLLPDRDLGYDGPASPQSWQGM